MSVKVACSVIVSLTLPANTNAYLIYVPTGEAPKGFDDLSHCLPAWHHQDLTLSQYGDLFYAVDAIVQHRVGGSYGDDP